MNYQPYNPAIHRDRFPVLSRQSLDDYQRINVAPHAGTSYGKEEARLYRGMVEAHKQGVELGL